MKLIKQIGSNDAKDYIVGQNVAKDYLHSEKNAGSNLGCGWDCQSQFNQGITIVITIDTFLGWGKNNLIWIENSACSNVQGSQILIFNPIKEERYL